MNLLVGRFYFKQTKNGNLLGEFSNNLTKLIFTECANIKSEFTKKHSFIGDYETVWFEKGAESFTLKIEFKFKNKEILKLTLTNPQNNQIIFHGEGFIVDKILIGNYQATNKNENSIV